MTTTDAKKTLIERYKYLYENAYFILAPFMYEQKQEEFEETKKEYDVITKPLIYLKLSIYDRIIESLEEFLLSDKKIEDSKLYQMVESKRNDEEYLQQVKKGLFLLEKENETREYYKIKLDLWNILGKLSTYIKEQSGDLNNKKNKLAVLDEYYRLLRYKNDGKIRVSGVEISIIDCNSIYLDLNEKKPSRDKKDTGIKNNEFINAIRRIPKHENNYSIFSEDEKQRIYLERHDELPWNMEILCNNEEIYEDSISDSRLIRPNHTKPCGKNFYINESEIFVKNCEGSYRYFQLCPHCGYIVSIPAKILSDGIKERIEKGCEKDKHLYRKMILYSELKQLDDIPVEGKRRLLKK